ncbi:MAG: hypothetical protein QME51_09300 [Planctomycetota bacterium]|nr:hypothetical protein [Planctomycetota bacterium]MDI6788553.1 hypothetical protein [Planctomycetota bacterium]
MRRLFLIISGILLSSPLLFAEAPPTELPEIKIISPTLSISPASEGSPVIIQRFEGFLDYVKDRTLIEQDEPYNAILRFISRLQPAEISNRIKTEITYNNLMESPQEYRGEIVRCKGVLLYLNPYRLRPNTAGIDIYYAGMLGNPSTNEFFRFHLIDKPQELLKNSYDDRSLADEVEVEGAFLKIAAYEIDARYNREGKDTQYAPFIIGRKITKVVHPPPKAAKRFQWIIGLSVAVILIGLFLYIFISSYNEKRQRRNLFIKPKIPPRRDEKH